MGHSVQLGEISTLTQLLERAARLWPDRLAWVSRWGCTLDWTFAQAFERVRATAITLSERLKGVEKPARVLIRGDRSPECLLAELAAIYAGAIPLVTGTEAQLPDSDFQAILAAFQPDLVLNPSTNDLQTPLVTATGPAHAERPAKLASLTSGAAGTHPRLLWHTHEQVILALHDFESQIDSTRFSRFASLITNGSYMNLIETWLPWACGLTRFFAPDYDHLRAVAEAKAGAQMLVFATDIEPLENDRVETARPDITWVALRAPLRQQRVDAPVEAAQHIRIAYGLAETAGPVSLDGKLAHSVEAKINTSGAICLRTPRAGSHWIDTGDLGYLDSEGKLAVIDRIDALATFEDGSRDTLGEMERDLLFCCQSQPLSHPAHYVDRVILDYNNQELSAVVHFQAEKLISFAVRNHFLFSSYKELLKNPRIQTALLEVLVSSGLKLQRFLLTPDKIDQLSGKLTRDGRTRRSLASTDSVQAPVPELDRPSLFS